MSPRVFVRLRNGIKQDIAFAERRLNPATSRCGAGVGVMIPEVHWLLNRGKRSEDLESTLGGDVGLLRQPPSYLEWELSLNRPTQFILQEIAECLKKYAIPFLDRLNSPAAVMKQLESPNPADWLANIQIWRDCKLAAWMYVQGDQEGACARLRQIVGGAGRKHDAHIREAAALETFLRTKPSVPARLLGSSGAEGAAEA